MQFTEVAFQNNQIPFHTFQPVFGGSIQIARDGIRDLGGNTLEVLLSLDNGAHYSVFAVLSESNPFVSFPKAAFGCLRCKDKGDDTKLPRIFLSLN